jgi:hypothetical protein
MKLSTHYIPLKDLVSKSDLATRGEKLELIYKSVLDVGIEASPAFYDSILKEFENIGDIERAEEIVKVYVNGVETYNCLMRMYHDNSVIITALLDKMKAEGVDPDSETYRAVIQALCNSSEYTSALDQYEDSIEAGITTHESVYANLVSCWCHTGDAEKAIDNVRLDPSFQNQTCIFSLSKELASLEMWERLSTIYDSVKLTIDIPTRAIFLRSFLNGSRDLSTACGVLKDTLETCSREDIEGAQSKAVVSMYESLLLFVAESPVVNGSVDVSNTIEESVSREAESEDKDPVDSPVQFCRDLVLDLQRNQLRMSPGVLSALVQIYTQFQELDDAMHVYLNYREASTHRVVNAVVPVIVYDTLLSNLAKHYRMQEFSSIWNIIGDTAADSTQHIALNAFISTMDIPSAMEICKNVMGDEDDTRHPQLSVFMDLFESCAITGKYLDMISVLQWIRRVPRHGKSKLDVSHILETRIVPISQSITPLISRLSHQQASAPPILLYQEFLALGVPLPYSLFSAMISYHARGNDMVNIAKTMSIVIKQSHTTGNPPRADCITAFLVAARDLCGREAASSVLKLVYSERLALDMPGFDCLMTICARNGWACELCDFVTQMDGEGKRFPWKLYGSLLDEMKEHGHADVSGVFKEFMMNGYPEVVGEHLEYKENGEHKDITRSVEDRL